MPNSPLTSYPMVEIAGFSDLQPGDTWGVSDTLYSRVTVDDADGGVLAWNTHLRLNVYLHISRFTLPRWVMRGEPPYTMLDALPSEADQEAIDNWEKGRYQWTK